MSKVVPEKVAAFLWVISSVLTDQEKNVLPLLVYRWYLPELQSVEAQHCYRNKRDLKSPLCMSCLRPPRETT